MEIIFLAAKKDNFGYALTVELFSPPGCVD
jgi:hypothetical protein